MEIFLKVTAVILVTSVATLTISKQGSDISLLLTILVCCMVTISAVSYIKPIIQFMERLVGIGQVEEEIYRILLKTTGIGLISRIASMICSDSGNQTLGKTLQFIATTVILCICVPLLDKMLSLIETVLGRI